MTVKIAWSVILQSAGTDPLKAAVRLILRIEIVHQPVDAPRRPEAEGPDLAGKGR